MSRQDLPDWLDFQPRLFPSCNLTWLAGPRPILVDTGFGSDLDATLGTLPGEPALVFNTHWHSDHVGGNAGLAARLGTPIAASAAEGARVNAGDPEAFASDWLDQPVEPYRVDRLVEPGERLQTGCVTLRAVPAAGHSPGQVALFEDRSRVLIAGDAILAADVSWINPCLDGAEALETAIATVERIGLLDARVAVAGHGEVIDDVAGCVRRSLERLRLWRRDPARMALHGCRRIFGFALMIHGGVARSDLLPYLMARRWIHSFAPLAGLSPEELAARLVSDLAGSGAARWERGRLVSTVPHRRLSAPAAGARTMEE
jgi:glyoxylase-like metal-dependent hydrolase (beta-lactamase superfamily II)